MVSVSLEGASVILALLAPIVSVSGRVAAGLCGHRRLRCLGVLGGVRLCAKARKELGMLTSQPFAKRTRQVRIRAQGM